MLETMCLEPLSGPKNHYYLESYLNVIKPTYIIKY